MNTKTIDQQKVIDMIANAISVKDIALAIDCTPGNVRYILRKNNIKWAGQKGKRRKSYPNILLGDNFGRWTVIATAPKHKNHIAWLVKCECGTEKIVPGYCLKNGDSKSCGCWSAECSRQKGLDQASKEPIISSARSIWHAHYKNKDDSISFEDFYQMSQLLCFYCKRPPLQKHNRYICNHSIYQNGLENGTFVYNGLDIIDSSKPHIKNNCVPCCKHCNIAKLAMTPKEFQIWLKQTSSHHLYNITSNELDEAVKMWKIQNEKAVRLL